MGTESSRRVRPPDDEHREHLDFVEDLMVTSTPFPKLVAQVRARFAEDFPEETIDNWRDSVYRRWAREAALLDDRAKVRAVMHAKLQYGQHVSLLAADRKGYLKALELEMDFHGLRTQVRRHENPDQVPIEALTPEQRRAEIKRLLDQRDNAEAAAATKH